MWAEGREQQLSPSSLPPPLAHSLAHTGVARERASHPAVRRRREYAQFRYEWMKIWQLHTERDVWNTISGSGWPVRCYVLLGPHLEQQRAVCLLLRNAISPKWSSACFFFFFFSTLGFYLVGRLESCVRVYVCLCVCACLLEPVIEGLSWLVPSGLWSHENRMKIVRLVLIRPFSVSVISPLN